MNRVNSIRKANSAGPTPAMLGRALAISSISDASSWACQKDSPSAPSSRMESQAAVYRHSSFPAFSARTLPQQAWSFRTCWDSVYRDARLVRHASFRFGHLPVSGSRPMSFSASRSIFSQAHTRTSAAATAPHTTYPSSRYRDRSGHASRSQDPWNSSITEA